MSSVVYVVREIWTTVLGDMVNASVPCADRQYAEFVAERIRRNNIKRDFAEDAWRVEIIEPTTIRGVK